MASVVLFSGGLDSAVLLALEARRAEQTTEECRDHDVVWPVYIRAGLAWEETELAAAQRLLASPPFQHRVQPLATLTADTRDVYPATHWALNGTPPAYDTPDEDVYLEGRNIVLIAKAGLYCARVGAGRLVLGPLAGNPFPDATPQFFDAMSRALSLGLARSIAIAAPLAHLHKEDVVRLGRELGVPLELTLSCMNPDASGRPCGRCSKCRERDDAFAAKGP